MLRSVLLGVLLVGCHGSVPQEPPLFPDPHIVGGSAVDIDQHPYQLSLQASGHICGASIISSKWAVTAGHCVGLPVYRYIVRAGSKNKNLGTPYEIKRIVRHPSYNPRTIDYDIALLEIDGVINFNDSVLPVELASTQPSDGQIVNVTGWGALKEGGFSSSQLMAVSVPIVNRDQCQDAYRNQNVITERMLCAGFTAGGKDSCQGDSGGPLTSDGVQYGIVSWGYGCAKPHYPGVYTNVASLRSWIKSISGV